VRYVHKGEGDHGGKDLWKRSRDGVMHSESGDDDELVRER